MDFTEQYKARRRTLEECMAFVQNGDSIIVSGAACEPAVFLNRVQDLAKNVEGVTLHKSRDGSYLYLRDPSMKGRVDTIGHFFADNLREGFNNGICSYLPSDLHNFMAIRSEVSPDKIFWARTTTMDENGELCVPYCQMFEFDALKNASHVICEVNTNPKYAPTNGGCRIPIERVDMLYEVNEPLFCLPEFKVTELDETIGTNVASLINDGDCIQLGLGGLPNAIGEHLKDKNDLGVHSEMFSANMARLVDMGVITGKAKNLNPGMHLATFVLGDENLYRVFSTNPACKLVPASYANDPTIIAANDNMVSVNTLMEIDLTGQVNAESIGPMQFSGTGGGDDYAIGALHSKGGKGIFAFESMTRKGVSKIKSTLTPGSVVSVSRNHVDYIVTEYGIARLRGRTVGQRAAALIEIAHPSVRDQLRSEARELGYI